MADDVINGLETMEEEEVITIRDEDRRDEIESCSLSLLGKFLTCKPFNKRAAQTTLRRTWGLKESVQIVEVGSNLFQFKFEKEFDNQVILLRRWQPGMTVANVKFDSMALWVQICGVSFNMFSSKVAFEIGSCLGEVVKVEK